MKIQCAICGFQVIDNFKTIFDGYGHKRPDVYFCDSCQWWRKI